VGRKIKAVVLEAEHKLVYKEDYPKPIPSSNDVIVKVHYCGICGSDISNYKYKLYGFTPIVMGHEFTGEIVELGENVKKFGIGEKIAGVNVSLDTMAGGELKGLGIFQDGGYAEYVLVNESNLFKIPKELGTRTGVMIESFANSVRAMKISGIGKNEKILIVGAGNIGLCTLSALLRKKNPEYVAVVDPQEYLRKRAIELGAKDALPTRKGKIKKFIKENGAPTYIFECAGNVNALILAVDIIAKHGTILVEGMHKGTIEFPMMLVNSKELTIKGCIGHSREDILNSISLVNKLKDIASSYIKEVCTLESTPVFFKNLFASDETVFDRKYIKPVIKVIS